eukprot:12503159-Heterocapsa_arctica.AAC.1
MRQQAEMSEIRQETYADYIQTESALEIGMTGARNALSAPRSTTERSRPPGGLRPRRTVVSSLCSPSTSTPTPSTNERAYR